MFSELISDCQLLHPAATAMESENTEDDNNLFIYSLRGDFEGVVDALVQGGRVAKRNPEGGTPLLVAAQNGHTDICGLLLAHGSDVNEMDLKAKNTALHLAAARGHEAVVEALLSWGAIVDPQSHVGGTPFFAACQQGHLACVLALLKAQASFSMAKNDGSLPIHVAAQENRVEIVGALLDYGCSPDMVSCCDNTFTTILLSFLLSAEQSERENTTHDCSIGSS